MSTSTFYGLSGFVKIYNPANATCVAFFAGQTVWNVVGALSIGSSNGTGFISVGSLGAYYNGTTGPITGLNFSFFSGNIQTGTIKIYGIT